MNKLEESAIKNIYIKKLFVQFLNKYLKTLIKATA